MAGLSKTDYERLKPYLARANLAFYASEYLMGPPDPPFNGHFMVVEHHEAWSDLVASHKLLCINAARGHGKSFFFNFAYPIWMADKHPRSKGFIFSGSQPQADMILAMIIREIEENPKLAHLLPPEKDRKMWSTKQIRLANGSEIYARGYGTKVRGVHPMWIVLDDVLNDNDAISKNVREKNIDYFFNAIRPTLLPKGQIIVIGTPFHQMDLYGKLAKTPGYHFASFPAIKDYEKGEKHWKVLWPEYFPLADLLKMRAEMGSIRFGREMLCDPKTDDASLFPSKLFTAEGVMQPMCKLGAPRRFWAERGVRSVYMGVDFGLSASVGSDFTVVWTMGLDENGNRWIMDIQRANGLSFSAQKALINDVAQKYRPGMIFLESNQAQRIFGETLIQETDLPIKLFQTGAEKHSLEEGVPGLVVLLENKKVRIPRGDENSVTITDIWIDEMRAMSFDGKVVSTGEHDDTVMAFWICNSAIAKGGFSFSFGVDEEDAAEIAEREFQELMHPSEDELDQDDEWMVLGATPQGRGRPRRINAQLVDALALEGDYEAESRRKTPELKPYREVQPQLGSPRASDLTRWR